MQGLKIAAVVASLLTFLPQTGCGRKKGSSSPPPDTTAPAAPAAPQLDPASDTGLSSSDRITYDATPTVRGGAGAAEALSTVSVYDGGTLLGTTVADATGAWSFTPGTALAEGALAIRVTATDAAGNTSPYSGTLSVTLDLTSPSVTIDREATQADSTKASPVHFTVVFDEAVTGFAGADVTLSGTAVATTAVVTEIAPSDGTTYDAAVSGMTSDGTVIASIAAGVATDAAGNGNLASTSTDNTVTYDTAGPSVTIDQAAAQADPTNITPVHFTAVFSEPVTGFADADVTLSGTAGATTAAVTEIAPNDGTTYDVVVSGMASDGTVIASIAAGVATDAAGNVNLASTSTDNTVTYDTAGPSVTVNQAGTQADPTKASPVHFTVVFGESVTGFADADVTLSGTAGATTALVSGGPVTYDVAVSGMTSDGTVIATIAAGVAADAAGNGNAASTSTDNTVTYDTAGPSVSINQKGAQSDPTSGSTVHFTAVFGSPVTGFADADVTLSGTAGATTAAVTEIAPNDGTTYEVAVSGMASDGTVIASIAAGVATDAAGNGNLASSSTDNTVTYDTAGPSVTINQKTGQADPTNASPVHFTVVFDEPVTDFDSLDVALSGTAGATAAAVTEIAPNDGTTYDVTVSGMATDGTVIASIAAGVATDAAGNVNLASTSTDNTVTYDTAGPSVTVNQAGTQADPASGTTIHFTAVFGSPVTGFATGDVTLSGTAGATTAAVTEIPPGDGTTYDVAVSGMATDGTVIATIAAGVAADAAGNGNLASTSTDNTITYDATDPSVTINQAAAQADPTNITPVRFTAVFSEPVTGFAAADVSLAGSTADVSAATVTVTEIAPGDGTTYDVSVGALASDGTVTASIAAGAATDAAGNGNAASTSTDNTVDYDATQPSVTIDQAAGQDDPTNASPVHFTVVFDEPVTDFDGLDVALSGTAGATAAAVTEIAPGDGTTYDVAVSGMASDGTVVAAVVGAAAVDAAGNVSFASTSTDNTVAFDAAPRVTVNQATGQADPASVSPVHFTVVFSEAVTGFDWTGVSFAGSTAPGTLAASVTGGPAVYDVAVSGMTGAGDVVVSLPAGAAVDAGVFFNPSLASASTDNVIAYAPGSPPTGDFVLLTPLDAASGQPTEPTLTWTDAEGETSYTVQIAADPGFGAPLVHEAAGLAAGTTSYAVPAGTLVLRTLYYWRVIAVNGVGNLTATNAPFRFTTLIPPSFPVADDQWVTTVKNTAVGIVLTGNDPDGTPLVFAIATGPSHGTLTGFNASTGLVTYTPAPADYFGPDSFTFTIASGGDTSTPATVSITVLQYGFANPGLAGGADKYGEALAMGDVTGDGKADFVVGAPNATEDSVTNAGLAYLYDGATGALLKTLSSPDGPVANSRFGSAVAVSGGKILVGASGAASGAGAAYLYILGSDTYVPVPNPAPSGNDAFGASAAAVADVNGNGAADFAVGVPGDSPGGVNKAGSVVLIDGLTGAVLQILLNPYPANNDQFGTAVASTGTTVIVGCPKDDPDPGTGAVAQAGTVYLFDGKTGALVIAIPNPAPGLGDEFGTSVTSVGNKIVAGAPFDDTTGTDSGAVYVFDTAGVLQFTLANPTPAGNDYFGISVASDGLNVFAGATGDDRDGIADVGIVHQFNGVSGAYMASLLNPDPPALIANDLFGSAIASQGGVSIIGAIGAGKIYIR